MVDNEDQNDCGSDDAERNQRSSREQLRPVGAIGLETNIKTIRANIDQDESKKSAQQIAESVKRFARYGKVMTAVIAVATVVQAVTSACQWKVTKDQYDAMMDANRVAKASADAAKIAADAAKHSNELAAANGKLQLRAWLGIETAIMSWDKDSSTAFLTLPIKNYGQTPAYEVVSVVEMAREPNDGQPIDWIIGIQPPESESATFSGPGHTENHVSAFKVSQDEYSQITDGRIQYVITGVIEFLDVFDDDRLVFFQARWHGKEGMALIVWDEQFDESGLPPSAIQQYYLDRIERLKAHKIELERKLSDPSDPE